MVKRYDGKTGRVIRVEDGPPLPEAPPAPPPFREGGRRPPPGGAFPGQNALPRQLRRLLSNSFGDLETEDLLLLLILYLLYRESGDQDWLMTLGAMLFLP
jgi:hypothetical protein